jgi:drug/metabolite transporter (DMT)-like permease
LRGELTSRQIFVLFRLADPGTIQLIKSGTILITAVVMILALGTNIAGTQWIAICMQVCGIVITQYNPSGGATYSILTYGLLLFHTTMSAVSSVFNQILCKNEGSLHAMNMTLYSSGTVINLALHVMVRILNEDEPGFFTGYGSFGAIMVIVSNVFIGLAMTAVYKCMFSTRLSSYAVLI